MLETNQLLESCNSNGTVKRVNRSIPEFSKALTLDLPKRNSIANTRDFLLHSEPIEIQKNEADPRDTSNIIVSTSH